MESRRERQQREQHDRKNRTASRLAFPLFPFSHGNTAHRARAPTNFHGKAKIINQLVKQSVENSRKARKSRCPSKLPLISSGEYGTIFALERAAGAGELAFSFIGSSSLLTSCDRAYTHWPMLEKASWPAALRRFAGKALRRKVYDSVPNIPSGGADSCRSTFFGRQRPRICTVSYARSIRLSQVYFSQQCSARQFTISRPATGGSEYESNIKKRPETAKASRRISAPQVGLEPTTTRLTAEPKTAKILVSPHYI